MQGQLQSIAQQSSLNNIAVSTGTSVNRLPLLPHSLFCLYLCNGPFDHRAAGQTGTVHFLKVVVGIIQVLVLHLGTNVITRNTHRRWG